MNVFRVIGIILVSIILLTTLVSFGTTETLQKSTKYENVKHEFTQISKNFIKNTINLESIIDQSLSSMQADCKTTNKTSYSIEKNGNSFNLSCDVINQGTDAIVDSIMNNLMGTFIEKTYYKEYNCGLLQCIQQQKPMVLISEKAHEYWTEKSNIFLLISLGLAVVLFFLTKHKSNFFLISGGLVIGTSIFVSQLPSIASNIASKAAAPLTSPLEQMGISSDIFSKIASAFFSQSGDVYLCLLLIGILIVTIGILFKLFGLAGKIAGLFKGKENKAKKKQKKNKKKSK